MLSARVSSVLPPPAWCEAYERLQPGTLDRLLTLTEEQAHHRMELESRVVDSNIQARRRGLTWGGAIALGGLVATLILGLTGHDIAAAGVGLADLGALAGVFVVGSNRQRRELREKADAVRQAGSKGSPQ